MCVCRYVYEEPRAKNSVNNKVLTILGATIVTSRNSYKDNIQVAYNLQKGWLLDIENWKHFSRDDRIL